MTKKIEFFMPMANVPTVTHQEKRITVRNGKPVVYEDARLSNARASLEAHLFKFKPDKLFTGAVRLTTKWCYYSNIAVAAYKTTRPDTDNMIKLLKDCMTKLGFWKDDAQVASEITEKFMVPDKPGIYVKVEEIGNASGL